MYVIKQSESGTNKVSWDSKYPYPEKLINDVNSAESLTYPLLLGIALYEDTYFNSQQCKTLIGELQRLKESYSEQQDKNAIESLIRFIETVKIQEHLVFIGD